MYVIKGFGFFFHRVFTDPHGVLWGRAHVSSQAEPDYRSAVKLQKKSFSCWTDCLLRIINHSGHMIFLSFKIDFKSSDMKMKPHYDKIIFHLLLESHPSSAIRENLRLSPSLWVRPGSIKCWLGKGMKIGLASNYLYIWSSYYVQDS